MITVQEHLGRILATVRRLPQQDVGLLDAQGCVLAEDVTATVDLPGFTNSAMDGYAVRAADLAGAADGSPVVLPVLDDIAAGDPRTLRLVPGTAMRIMTGAALPAGADAIVPVELSDGGTREVALRLAPERGRHVRERGGDVQAGAVVLEAGTVVGPGQVALLAASGRATVSVVRRPRVAVVSTGDELVEPGLHPGYGRIIDSNSVMLCALLAAAGDRATRVGGVPDDGDALLAVLEAQLEDADAIVTTGGVSMGAYDTVKEVLSKVGTVRFDKVAMRPGMPQGFGVLGTREVPVFTLPGNPVSALVSFQVFVAPALRAMAGRRDAAGVMAVRRDAGGAVAVHRALTGVDAVAGQGWQSVAGKTEFSRVVLRDGIARLAGGQGSHMLGALAQANALAVVPPEVAEVQEGDQLSCLPLLGVGLP